jgi:hypothetical protein
MSISGLNSISFLRRKRTRSEKLGKQKDSKFPDKYDLSRKELTSLLKRNIVELVYNTGEFEGENPTLSQVKGVIKFNRADNLSEDDVIAIVNLEKGFELLLDDIEEPLLETSKRMNRTVLTEDAFFPGEILTGGVRIIGEKVSPRLTEVEVKDRYEKIMKLEITTTEKALRLFLFILKDDVFFNENIRTAVLTANKVMLDNGKGLLSIPTSLSKQFEELFWSYYDNGSDDEKQNVLNFMYSNCIFGIEEKIGV